MNDGGCEPNNDARISETPFESRCTSSERIITFMRKRLLTYLSKTCILIENKQTSPEDTLKHCPRCQATHFVKNGFVNEKQRYKCKRCEYQFTRTTPRGHPPEHKKLTVLLYCHGISMRAISKLFQVSTNAVLKWIRTLAKKQAPKPSLAPRTQVVLELDEMWHYIQKKKNKLWIWKALDRNTGYLIDWECGDRDKENLRNSRHVLLPSTLKYIIPTNGRSMKPYSRLQNMFRRKQRHIGSKATIARCATGLGVLNASPLSFPKVWRW